MKKVLTGLFVALSFFVGIECLLRLSAAIFSIEVLKDKGQNWPDISEEYFTHLDAFQKDHFCDGIHTKDAGHRLTGICLAGFFDQLTFDKGPINLIATGGSTTEGRDCNAKTRWTDELMKLMPTFSVLNLGKSSENSSYALEKLKDQLRLGNIPKYVLWGSWINDVVLKGSHIGASYEIKVWAARLYKTFYQHVLIFRSLVNTYSAAFPRSFTLVDIGNIFDNPEDSIAFFSQTNNSAISYFQPGLNNYEANSKIVSELAAQYHFNVITVALPYVPNMYRTFYPKLNLLLEDAIGQIKRKQLEVSRKLGFSYVDIQACFENHRKMYSK